MHEAGGVEDTLQVQYYLDSRVWLNEVECCRFILIMLQEDQTVENEWLQGRMDFEINRDYPGSGANNRHTPNPPVKE